MRTSIDRLCIGAQLRVRRFIQEMKEESGVSGNVAALWAEPQIIGPIDAWGRARPIHADVELERIPCDVIVVAIGQGIELRPFEEAGIKIKRGTISALSSSELANNEGVFAGGDCVTGPATVIRAIAAGKVAAANIDEYLGYNHTISCDVVIPDPSIDDKRPCGRIQMHETEAGERKHTFEPIECGMTKQEAFFFFLNNFGCSQYPNLVHRIPMQAPATTSFR